MVDGAEGVLTFIRLFWLRVATHVSSMYHLLKGLHEHLTRCVNCIRSREPTYRLHRKEEFSVIIVGLDGAGKTVRALLGPFCWLFFTQRTIDSSGENKDTLQ
jgi:hypothetical protein